MWMDWCLVAYVTYVSVKRVWSSHLCRSTNGLGEEEIYYEI